MDKAWWWEQSGELPAIFNWALVGLARLFDQKEFTESEVVNQTLEEYKLEVNPAKQFLVDYLEEDIDHKPIKSSFLYHTYREWAKDGGYFPLSNSQFMKELKRQFPLARRVRKGNRGERIWCYVGVKFCEGMISDIDSISGYLDES